MDLDDYNQLTFTFDVNKLLVPTQPIYATDTNGQPIPSGDGFEILAGEDPNRAVPSGMFGSFSDAPGTVDANGNVEPGSVFAEEMREFTLGGGIEYWYDQQFSFRGGYFWEHELKGNRKYFTVGAGLRYNVFGLDLAYLIPAAFGSRNNQTSPLQNTIRFTLTFNFESLGGDAAGEDVSE